MTIAVVDHSAARRDLDAPLLLAARLLDEITVLEELKIDEPANDRYDPEKKDSREDEETTGCAVRGLRHGSTNSLYARMAERPRGHSALNLRPDAKSRVGDLNQPGALVEDRPGSFIALLLPLQNLRRVPRCL